MGHTGHEMDVRDLKFDPASFDVAIDKGTMDAMMTAKGDVWVSWTVYRTFETSDNISLGPARRSDRELYTRSRRSTQVRCSVVISSA